MINSNQELKELSLTTFARSQGVKYKYSFLYLTTKPGTGYILVARGKRSATPGQG